MINAKFEENLQNADTAMQVSNRNTINSSITFS